MTLNFDTETWWLPGSPPTRCHMEAMTNSLPKPISEDPIQNWRKGAKISKEDTDKISENEINSNSKIQNSVNSRIKSGTSHRK